jgi:hypothetical protein
VQVILTYKKETTGETVKRICACYSYRYRRLKRGIRKLLFAWDMEDQRIKGFVVNNIRNVAILDRKFVPRWPIELG